MKTDSIFYRLFQIFPGIFFELIGQSSTEGNAYEFKSVEIKETAKRIDGIFLPDKRSRKPIYFVEIQFQLDKNFYYRFFIEIFLYLGLQKSKKDWYAVAVFKKRSVEPAVPRPYRWLIGSPHIKRVYLDELGEAANQSVGLGIVQLVVENQRTAKAQARQLIQKAQQEIEDEAIAKQVLELIETILVYKFRQLSRQEIEAMFGLSDLKQTRVYQEAKEEGKQEAKEEGKQEGEQEAKSKAIPRLLKLGLSVEQIAEALELNVEIVRQAARPKSDS